ncbi:MAG TPA: response regulator [Chthoniobacter sp.]|jgi:DNA-binding response OmpR family regulator
MNRVLIVDDDPACALALQVLLRNQGYSVRIERDSPLALDAVQEFEPNAVLIDIMNPKSRGGDVAWQLASERTLNGTKLILYSQLSTAEVRRKLPAGEIPILEKPIDVDELMRLLAG